MLNIVDQILIYIDKIIKNRPLACQVTGCGPVADLEGAFPCFILFTFYKILPSKFWVLKYLPSCCRGESHSYIP